MLYGNTNTQTHAAMIFAIDTNSQIPLYRQIAMQIKFAIANGAYRTDELIPSVRELANELTLNPNTVSSAYRELQEQGIVYPKRGLGLAVSERSTEKCRQERIETFRLRFRQLLDEAKQSGLTENEINTFYQ